jgi:outer membrane protein assembly factor BamB
MATFEPGISIKSPEDGPMTNPMAKWLSLGTLALLLTGAAANWPAFRGPHGDGVSADSVPPALWADHARPLWQSKLPGPGGSTPVVWGDRVFVTCYSGYADGRSERTEPKDLRRHLVCLDRDTGRVLWDRAVAARLPEARYARQIREHGYATSSPATDGRRVYVFFGRTGVLAFDFAGNRLWERELGKGLNGWGSASSPALYGNLVLVNATVECGALVALDAATGDIVWRSKVYGDSWATPLIVDLPGGRHEVVINGQETLYGFDPGDGRELWRCDTTTGAAASTPLARGDVVFVMGGGGSDRLVLAVRAGGHGDVTGTRVLWKQTRAGASNCSPLLVGDYLYLFSGQATCLRADTGKVVYQERLAGLGPEYASPAAAGDSIFLFTRRGSGRVLAAGPRFQVRGRIELDAPAGFIASPAVSGGRLFVRSGDIVYCLGAAPPARRH